MIGSVWIETACGEMSLSKLKTKIKVLAEDNGSSTGSSRRSLFS